MIYFIYISTKDLFTEGLYQIYIEEVDQKGTFLNKSNKILRTMEVEENEK